MSAIDEILSQIPMDQLAQQVGSDPQSTETAARGAVQALLGGLEANAQDADGERSIADALTQHDPSLIEGGVDLNQVDSADGQRIVSHIFGSNEDQVTERMGAVGGLDSGLVKKLLPILAPIVLSYLAKRLSGQGGLAGMLGGILGGMATREQQSQGGGANLPEILGGLLGGGRR